MSRLFAATAGIAFAASLIYGGYFYLHALDQPARHFPPNAIWHNLAWLTVFALHHSAMARTGAKQWLARLVPPALERAMYVWVASLLYFAMCWVWRRMPGEFYELTGPASWPFFVLQMSGAVSAWLGAARLDPLELAGLRQAASTSEPMLQTTGIYGWVRHPLYLGWVLMVWGTPHMTADRLLFAASTTAYLVIAVPFEERSLVRSFGRPYEEYRRRVPWRILPGLY